MHFSSDNASGVAPEIMDALAHAAVGHALAYGDDEHTGGLREVFSSVFDTETTVYSVATGTAANALILATLCPPWGAVLCHRESHINLDEGGAPEMFTGGAKLIALEGAHGKLTVDGVEEALARWPAHGVHNVVPSVLSLTQATEAGTVYTPSEISDLCDVARKAGMKVHMDGARFANALATLGVSPADATWRLGVDALSFGATKNGAMAAEAALFFDPELAETFERRRKRAGHLFSKMRYLSVQLAAYLQDGLWLRLAATANARAAELARAIEARPGVRLVHPVEANEVFAQFDDPAMPDRLREAGVVFAPWDAPRGLIRLVASFQTTEEDVRAFETVLNSL